MELAPTIEWAAIYLFANSAYRALARLSSVDKAVSANIRGQTTQIIAFLIVHCLSSLQTSTFDTRNGRGTFDTRKGRENTRTKPEN